MRARLPDISRGPDCQCHPYPYQLAFSAQEYLQGLLFLYAVSDAIAGGQLAQFDAMDSMRDEFEASAPGIWDQGWTLVAKNSEMYGRHVIHNALISMVSEWDWYARRLAAFVGWARNQVACSSLSARDSRRWNRFNSLPFGEQLDLLEVASDVGFGLPESTRADLVEMSLVRNLGIHNRWEVDSKYLLLSANSSFELGDIRVVSNEELNLWHEGLVGIFNRSATSVAGRFVGAPDFCPTSASSGRRELE